MLQWHFYIRTLQMKGQIELYKNGWTDRHAHRAMDWDGHNEGYYFGDPEPHTKGDFFRGKDMPVLSYERCAVMFIMSNLEFRLQSALDMHATNTRRPASADRTARRQFQDTGQPVSRTQASDA